MTQSRCLVQPAGEGATTAPQGERGGGGKPGSTHLISCFTPSQTQTVTHDKHADFAHPNVQAPVEKGPLVQKVYSEETLKTQCRKTLKYIYIDIYI